MPDMVLERGLNPSDGNRCADFTMTGIYKQFIILDWLSLEDLLIANVRRTSTLLTCSNSRPKPARWVSHGREEKRHFAFLVALYYLLRHLYLRLINPSHLSTPCLWNLTQPFLLDERVATRRATRYGLPTTLLFRTSIVTGHLYSLDSLVG